jgi:hypothetical protein
MKIQELIEENAKLVLVTEDRQEVALQDVAEMVAAKKRDIAYAENTIRSAEQQLVTLRAELIQLTGLHATAVALRPAKVEEKLPGEIEEGAGR